MKMVLCKNGHFFDEEMSEICPYCGADKASDNDSEEETENFDATTILSDAEDSEATTFLTDAEDSEATTFLTDAEDTEATTILTDAEDSEATTFLTDAEDTEATTILTDAEDNEVTTVFENSETDFNGNESEIESAAEISQYAHLSADGLYYCYHCFHSSKEPFKYCPKCGTMNTVAPKSQIHLYPGTILQNRYVIGLAESMGGFGIVYRAYDTKLRVIVAIKEFFPRQIVTRAPGTGTLIITNKSRKSFEYFKTRFLSEARTMAKFGDNKNIPNVFEFFEENETTYFVMEYLDGINLRDYIVKNNGHVDPDFAVEIALEVGNALDALHKQNIIHRDVAPDNIFICSDKNNDIKLIDLGAAKLTDGTDEAIDRVMKPGFSPPEQYDEKGKIGPWTDIYALGATMYTMMTGKKPEESTNRVIQDNTPAPIELNPSISENMSNTIMKAMAVEPHMRFKSAADMMEAIKGELKVKPLEEEKKIRRTRQLSGIAAGAAIILIAALLFFRVYFKERDEEVLSPATIDIWFSVESGSTEETAMQVVADEFIDKYPDITINLRAIPENEYLEILSSAAESDTLPDLFESTILPSESLKDARSVDSILKSEQAKECLFLNQYGNYYSDTKKLPIAIAVPVAYVITSGAVSTDYSSEYFSDISDFSVPADEIVFDSLYSGLNSRNYNTTGNPLALRKDFMNGRENKYAVMLSSTMQLNEVREVLSSYQKTYVYPDFDKIYCDYTYEWSLGKGTEASEKAADKLLSWFLGNVYQNYLMISEASDGQIPMNQTCFESKISTKYYSPISMIYKKFVFSISEESELTDWQMVAQMKAEAENTESEEELESAEVTETETETESETEIETESEEESTEEIEFGWNETDAGRKYIKDDGSAAVDEWIKDDGVYYHFDSEGFMQTGWITVDDKTYFLKDNGEMAAGEWIDGYFLNDNGSWTYEYKAEWTWDDSKLRYEDSSGECIKDDTVTIDNKEYTFTEDGYLDGVFLDVPSTASYSTEIAWALKNEIIDKNLNFDPEGSCMLWEGVDMLYKLSGSPEVTGENPFSDVPEDASYYNAVIWAYNEDIIPETDGTEFMPKSELTRAQAVQMLYKVAGSPELKDEENNFTDISNSDVYYNAVVWAAQNKLTNGTTDTTFSPSDNCKRYQFVVFLKKFNDTISEDEAGE